MQRAYPILVFTCLVGMAAIPVGAQGTFTITPLSTEVAAGDTLPIEFGLSVQDGSMPAAVQFDLDVGLSETSAIGQTGFVASDAIAAFSSGDPFTQVDALLDGSRLRVSLAMIGAEAGMDLSNSTTVGTLNIVFDSLDADVTITPQAITFDEEFNTKGVTLGSPVTIAAMVGDPNDINGDGVFTLDDVSELFNNFLGGIDNPLNDVNGDGVFTLDDVNELFNTFLTGGGKVRGLVSAGTLAALVPMDLLGTRALSLAVDSTTKAQGETLSVDVVIDNADDLNSISVDVLYDGNVFSYAGGSLSEIITGSGFVLTGIAENAIPGPNGEKRIRIAAALLGTVPAGTGGGALASFQLLVSDAAANGNTSITYDPTDASTLSLATAAGAEDVTTAPVAITIGAVVEPATPTPTETPTATPTNTELPPTATATNTEVPPTSTPTESEVATPTSTESEVATPTNTEVPPTATPTDTESEVATPTSTESEVATPTNTEVPPTATPTNTESEVATPTSTESEVATPTSTEVPPTPTSTESEVATPTDTEVPPTPTSTESEVATPTNTEVPPTPTPTDTESEVATPTDTVIPPTPTETEVPPTATETEVPPTPTITPTPTEIEELPEPPFSTSGVVLFAGLTDDVRFFNPVDQVLSISVGDFGGQLDPAFEVLDSDGNLVVSDDDSGPEDDAFVAQSFAAGVYRVVISGQSLTAGEYSLSVLPAAVDSAIPLIGFGQQVQGRIEPGAEIAEYTFFAQQGDRIAINVSDKLSLDQPGSALDPFVELFNPLGFAVADDDDSGPDDDARLVIDEAPITGAYIIQVSDSPEGRQEYGRFLLTLEDNTQRAPMEIALGETVESSISAAGQVDTFNFANNTGSVVWFVLDDFDPFFGAGSALDPFLTLENADGIMQATDDNMGPADDAQLSTAIDSGGVKVSGGGDLTMGAYTLTYQSDAPAPPDLAQGEALLDGTLRTKTFIFRGEADDPAIFETFTITVAADSTALVIFTDNGSTLDPAFRISGGDIIGSDTITDLPPDFRTKPNEDDAGILLTEPGTYTLEAFGQNGSFGRGSMELRVIQ